FLRSASIAGLRRDAVQPDIEAERKKRDEIEAGKSYCSRRFGGATCDDKSAQIYRSEERRVGKECRSRWSPHHQKKKNAHASRAPTRVQIFSSFPVPPYTSSTIVVYVGRAAYGPFRSFDIT